MGPALLKIFIILLFLIVILLMKKFRRQNIRFQNKEDRLVQTMHSMQQKQLQLNAKVKLSEDFNVNYQKSRNEIARSIYETNVELLETIVDQNKSNE